MTSSLRRVLRYIVFALIGYVLAFIFIFALFAFLEVSGWYVVYIPFLAILGSVVAIFFVNIGRT